MNIEEIKAHKALDLLFNSVQPLNKESKFILVKVENCTIYIPVNILEESKVIEFRERFKTVYDLTQGN